MLMDKRSPPQQYSLQEVRKHAHADDLWMVIYNKVYDVTTFAPAHPGGGEVLFDCAGVDATAAFKDVGHSEDAFHMLLPYLIGELYPIECVEYAQMKEHMPATETKRATKKRKPHERLKRKALVASLSVVALCALATVVGLQKLQWVKLTAHVT